MTAVLFCVAGAVGGCLLFWWDARRQDRRTRSDAAIAREIDRHFEET